MQGLRRCIASLEAQTTPPERIFLCIPQTYRRFETLDPLPFKATELGSLVEIVPCTDDGPGTKILGAIDRLPQVPDALLVLVDDDAEYELHMLGAFAEMFRKHPGDAGSFHVYRYRGINVGQGNDGFAIPVAKLAGLKGFHANIRDNPYIFYVDDLWISFYLWMNSVPIHNLTAMSGLSGYIRKIYNDVDALARQTGTFTRRRTMSRSIWYLRSRYGVSGLLKRLRARLKAD